MSVNFLLKVADATGDALGIQSGRYKWTAWGTWGGASAQLQWSPDDGATWIDVDGALLTADGGFYELELAEGSVRVAVSDAGSTTLSSRFDKIPAVL